MKVAAIVPAKGNSERVENKNTRNFNGEPLFVFTVRKLLKCSYIDEVYVDSEDEGILRWAVQVGARVLRRDSSLASNKTDGNQLFLNEVAEIEADIYIQHLCTSPFITEKTIREAVALLQTPETPYDSVVLGEKSKRYAWQDGAPLYDIDQIPNSVDLPDSIAEAMGLYVITREAALKMRRRIGERPMMLYGSPTELIDVNTEDDLLLAQKVATGMLSEEESRLRMIGRFLSSPVLSDVLDELGIDGVLSPEYSANIPGAKFLGRARPLHIRAVTPEDEEGSIYKALESYKSVVTNDVIIVKNDLPHLAYFGDLNMSLSIRSGAVGAVIAGMTRDNKATAQAGFPVFAKGQYCKDIKNQGAVASMNQPIEIDGITINPSDLVFADVDGIVCIPRTQEDTILRLALEVLASEKSILSDICQDVEVSCLVEQYGFF